MLKDSRPAPVFAACLFALALVILIGLVPAFASEHNPSFPFSSTALVPSSSLGDFVLDNVIPYRSTHWKPAPANERWWPNTQQQGKLSGVAIIINGTRWIRAKATVIRWSQDSINWILAAAKKVSPEMIIGCQTMRILGMTIHDPSRSMLAGKSVSIRIPTMVLPKKYSTMTITI